VGNISHLNIIFSFRGVIPQRQVGAVLEPPGVNAAHVRRLHAALEGDALPQQDLTQETRIDRSLESTLYTGTFSTTYVTGTVPSE
jgi:hypothetical protein